MVPGAISTAADASRADSVSGLLQVGDHYSYRNDVEANRVLDDIWAALIAADTWVADNPLVTYEFWDDCGTVTNWGRAYRHSGFDVQVGGIRPFTAGTYTSVDGVQHLAVILQTWDNTFAEILVLTGPDSFTHAVQNSNRLPIINHYQARSRA